MLGTILILGGAGLVGHAIVCELQAVSFPGVTESPFKPVVVDRRPHPIPLPGVEYVTGPEVDVFNPKFMLELVARFKPIAIIDSVNIASLASKQGDIAKYVTDYVFGVIEPIVRSGIPWIDIGTVATGGMGMNLGFTHNEASNGDIAPGLIRKNLAASVHGGQLDLLGRTPGRRVGRVVPRGMIGFETPFHGPITVGNAVPRMAFSQFLPKHSLHPVTFQLDGEYTGVGVRCGENGQFGLEETIAITALGMMEVVSAEAVAGAAIETMMRLFVRSGTYIQSDLHPEPTSFAQRQRLVKQMTKLSEGNQVHSVAFSNLGPYLTVELWELLVTRLLGFTPRTLAAGIADDLKVSQHGDITNMLSVHLPGLGIPVVTDHFFCPARLGDAMQVSVEEITEQLRRVDLPVDDSNRLWAVDLRHARLIGRWQEAARKLLAADPQQFLRSHLPLSWDELIRPGSFWAALATVEGHGRGDFSAGSLYL